jgi:hypothetical protein
MWGVDAAAMLGVLAKSCAWPRRTCSALALTPHFLLLPLLLLFFVQAGVDAAAMRGVLEKSDLLRVAKAHMRLWECRRIVLCGELAQDVHMRLYRLVSSWC